MVINMQRRIIIFLHFLIISHYEHRDIEVTACTVLKVLLQVEKNKGILFIKMSFFIFHERFFRFSMAKYSKTNIH